MVLATGDLVDRGDRDSYLRLRDALSALPFPVHFALGNHDARAAFGEVFPETAFADGFLQYAVEAGPLRLLVLDTLEEGRHGGAFCNTRAAWLAAQLDAHPNQPTLIVLHHPPMEVGIPWMNTDPAEPWVERLAATLRGRSNVLALVCGHIHRAITARWNGLTVATCPSTAPQVGLDLRPIDPAVPDDRVLIVADPPGYALHWWNGRELITHWDVAGDRTVIARYNAGLQGMISDMMAERPV
jgi:3',5'-cyclic AMP phosphodiesterase CpdA